MAPGDQKALLPPFGALAKRRWPRASVRGEHNPVCGQTSPQVYAGMSADQPAATFCLIAGRPPTFSGVKKVLRNACGIHGGRNPLPAKRTAGISRRAAKPGFFPQKTLLFHSVARGKRNCPSAISTPRFGLRKNPRLAGPRLLRPIAARYL